MIWQGQQLLGVYLVVVGCLIGMPALALLGRRGWVRWTLRFGPRRLEDVTAEIQLQQGKLHEARAKMIQFSLNPDEPYQWVGFREWRALSNQERELDSAKTNKYMIELKLELLERRRRRFEEGLETARQLHERWTTNAE